MEAAEERLASHMHAVVHFHPHPYQIEPAAYMRLGAAVLKSANLSNRGKAVLEG